MTADGDNLTFNACVNTHSIAFYTKTTAGSPVVVDTENTPIRLTSKGDRYVLTYKNWQKAGGDVETTITVDGKTYNVKFNFTDGMLIS